MSLALPRFVLTVLAASPSSPTDPSNTASVIWTLDAVRLEAAAALEVSGEPQTVEFETVTALHFDGIDDALFVACNPIVGAAAFTIEVLIAPEADGPEAQRFLHIEDEAGRRVLLELRLNPENMWALDTFIYENKENRCVLLDRTKLHPTGQWRWVALRFDSGIMTHFVDGVPEGQGQVAFKPMGGGRTSIGVRQNKVSWYQGLIREVRFHRTALPVDALQRR